MAFKLQGSLVVVAACGNTLPPPGSCPTQTNGEMVEVATVSLPGGLAAYDDLRYSPELDKVVAAPHGTGKISLIEPESLAVQSVNAPTGVESADASASTVYAADRSNARIVAIDVASGTIVAAQMV